MGCDWKQAARCQYHSVPCTDVAGAAVVSFHSWSLRVVLGPYEPLQGPKVIEVGKLERCTGKREKNGPGEEWLNDSDDALARPPGVKYRMRMLCKP